MKVIQKIKKKIRQESLTLRQRFSRIDAGADNIELIDLAEDTERINEILRSTEKEFTGFISEGADYSAQYFSELAKAFSLDSEISCACGVIRTKNGTLLNLCGKGKGKFKISRPGKDYTQTLMFPEGALFRTSVIRKNGIYFSDDLRYCGDTVFAVRYQEKGGAWVRLNGLDYKTDTIPDRVNPEVPQSGDSVWYTESTLPLVKALRSAEGDLSDIAQYALLYMTILRFMLNRNSETKMIFSSFEETDSYIADAGRALQNVRKDILFSRKGPAKWDIDKLLYLARLRDPGNDELYGLRPVENDAVLHPREDRNLEICRVSEINLYVLTIHMVTVDGRPGLDLTIRNPEVFPAGYFEICFTNDSDGSEHIAKPGPQLSRISTFFSKEGIRMTSFRVFIPFNSAAEEQSISAFVRVGECRIDKEIRFANKWQNKLNSEVGSSFWCKNGYTFTNRGGKINIKREEDPDITAYEAAYVSDLKKLAASAKNNDVRNDIERALEWRRLYRQTEDQYRGRRIWAYYDKGYKAGDNAEYAIRYAAEQEDGIEKLFYIDAGCADYNRLREEGYSVMDPKSGEAILNAMHAEVIYMTHVPPYRKLGIPDRMLKYVKDLLDAKVIRLYHGFPITSDGTYSQLSSDAAAVAVGTSYEKELYMNEDNGYTEAQIIESGMPRYDDLVFTETRQLLIAPSWRPSLAGKSTSTGESLYNEKFRESLYFRHYDALITDPRLLETARKYGYKIKVFMHPKLSAQTCDFTECDVVEALSCTKDIDYVTIMKQSSLMVTDYSSVQYDFAYMRKPVVYFHSQDLPYWRPTIFDYEKIGLGEICESVDELVEVLCGYMSNQCRLKDEYRERVEKFYIHSDRESGRRLYEETLKLFE